VSGGLYFKGITNETVAKFVRATNYALTIIALFLQLVALYAAESDTSWARVVPLQYARYDYDPQRV